MDTNSSECLMKQRRQHHNRKIRKHDKLMLRWNYMQLWKRTRSYSDHGSQKLLKNNKTSPFAKVFVSVTASPMARLICDAKLTPIVDIASFSRLGTRVLYSSGKANIHLQQKYLLFTRGSLNGDIRLSPHFYYDFRYQFSTCIYSSSCHFKIPWAMRSTPKHFHDCNEVPLNWNETPNLQCT